MEGGKQYLYPLMALLVALVVCSMIGNVDGAVSVPRYTLTRQYYKKTNTCAHVEAYVKHNVKVFWDQDKSITPKLLRLLYSDCMVTAGGPSYPILTGRRDGLFSKASSVDLPSPNISWEEAFEYFQARGLDIQDFTTLLGAHSTGRARCRYIRDRLYNFQGRGTPDPTLDSSRLKELRKQCPEKYKKGEHETLVTLNKNGGEYRFTNSYYSNVMAKKAVLRIDQQLLYGNETQQLSEQFSDPVEGFEDFRKSFALSMNRLGNYKVLTGQQGEIRNNCHFTNTQ
ncbi:hypothetical protein SOVF_156750 [Spinacia oleracea]|nr:hypothetical protein SOVF_156750 [Spinacia oleracea]